MKKKKRRRRRRRRRRKSYNKHYRQLREKIRGKRRVKN